MNGMFVKLFTQILDSSIADDRRLRHFFTDLLLCADGDGNIVMTDSAIARRIGASQEEVQWGLAELQKPDPMSKTPDCEGRRIERIGDTGYGWHIINFEAYRALRDSDQMRAVTRARVQRFRDKQKSNVTETQRNGRNSKKKESQSTEKEPESEPFLCEALNIYNSYPRKVAKPDAIRAIKKALANPPRGMNTTDWASQLLESTKRFAAANARSDPKYIPHPATWFNSERFNDDPETWKGSSAPAEKKPTPRDFFA